MLVHPLRLQPKSPQLRRHPRATVETGTPQPLPEPDAESALGVAAVPIHQLRGRKLPRIVVVRPASFGGRRDGDPDCVRGDFVGGGVGDFEVVFRGGRGGAGEGGEVGFD